MDMPKEGDYFYDGLGHFCRMLGNKYYQPINFRRPLMYIHSSEVFSCRRLATQQEIQREIRTYGFSPSVI